jgi:hypothetical protein
MAACFGSWVAIFQADFQDDGNYRADYPFRFAMIDLCAIFAPSIAVGVLFRRAWVGITLAIISATLFLRF